MLIQHFHMRKGQVANCTAILITILSFKASRWNDDLAAHFYRNEATLFPFRNEVLATLFTFKYQALTTLFTFVDLDIFSVQLSILYWLFMSKLHMEFEAKICCKAPVANDTRVDHLNIILILHFINFYFIMHFYYVLFKTVIS